jgi:hypothetical protein
LTSLQRPPQAVIMEAQTGAGVHVQAQAEATLKAGGTLDGGETTEAAAQMPLPLARTHGITRKLDVILQFPHQSHACRLVEFHRVHSEGSGGMGIFNGGAECAGEAVTELTPRTNKTGRCLVMLAQPSASPALFVKWIGAHPVLKRRVMRVYHVDARVERLARTVTALCDAIVASDLPQPVRLQLGPLIAGHEVRVDRSLDRPLNPTCICMPRPPLRALGWWCTVGCGYCCTAPH